MKNVRLIGIVFVCMLTALVCSAQIGTKASDVYDVQLVRSWFNLPISSVAGNSFLEKTIYRSGDRIAISIVHAFSERELLEPNRTRQVLALIKIAFSEPAYISAVEDRNPAVTKLLLLALESRCTDRDLKKEIESTLTYVESQVKSMHLSERP